TGWDPSPTDLNANPSRMDWQDQRARLRWANEGAPTRAPDSALSVGSEDLVQNLNGEEPDYEVYRSSRPMVRDYNGPLSLGDPGVSASLWQESKRDNSLYRDERAWRPLDLITILVFETSEGKKEADTEVKHKSKILAAIESFLGIDSSIDKRNSQMKFPNVVSAQTTNDFKGEGETTRKGSLKATISGMVVEVLPGDILRIEGKKIISVNQEEQIMVISGLVRPRDIDSTNQVDSAKIANLRIDYYGNGTVGEAQTGGWFTRLVRVLWPF
ncbi:MAG: flagellar basal body L-ring protein FlgH, partial [Deltaproteobacteria bacterium]|nr:flagellar basal body L-ring protein FlgH [Deltaproteobacteria bacterium]